MNVTFLFLSERKKEESRHQKKKVLKSKTTITMKIIRKKEKLERNKYQWLDKDLGALFSSAPLY